MKPFLSAAIAGVVLWAGPGIAQECPALPDHRAELEDLISQSRHAGTEQEGRRYSDRMWALWTDAPDESAQVILDAGMRRRSSYDYLGVLEEFDRLVGYCPDYAEGYNQRAFVNFLRGSYTRALVDLDEALKRAPRHIAALSGKALTLMALGRKDEARRFLAQALEMNPWLPERGLAAPGGPLEPLGEDI